MTTATRKPRIVPRTVTALLDIAAQVRDGRLTNESIAARLENIAIALDRGADGRETQTQKPARASR